MKAVCFECGAQADHEHHVVPRSLGGTRTVPLCERCHGLVHARTMNTRALTTMAMQHMKAQGLCTGKAPYGYTLAVDGKTLVECPAEQAVIARIHEGRKTGLSVRQITADLEAAGIVNRKGNPLALTQIVKIAQAA